MRSALEFRRFKGALGRFLSIIVRLGDRRTGVDEFKQFERLGTEFQERFSKSANYPALELMALPQNGRPKSGIYMRHLAPARVPPLQEHTPLRHKPKGQSA